MVPTAGELGKSLAGARVALDSTKNQPFRGLEACVLNMTTLTPFVFSVIIAFLFSEH